MRPRLLPGVACLPSEDGVLVTSPTAGFVIKGDAAAPLLDQLLPALDGTRDLDTVAADYEGQGSQVVRNLVEMMVRNGVVRDAAHDPPHGLTAQELDYHGDALRVLEMRAGGPAARLQRVLETPVVVAVDDRTAFHQVAALVRVGFRRFHAVCEQPAQATRDRIDRLVAAERADEPVPRLTFAWSGELADALTDAGPSSVVLTHRAGAAPDEVADLHARASTADRLCSAVVWDRGTGWCSPPGVADEPGWTSLLWRLRGSGRLAWETGRPGGPTPPGLSAEAAYVTDPVLAVAANRAALSLLDAVAGVGDASQGWRVDAATLEMTPVRVRRHACAAPVAVPRDRAAAAAALARREATHAPPPEAFSGDAARLIDEHAGPLLSLGEGDLPQAPLSATVIDVADTGGVMPSGEPVRVVEPGVDIGDARTRCARRALEIAAVLGLDHRAGASRWATDPATGDVVQVDDPLAALRAGAPPSRLTLPGLASGGGHAEALRRALLGLVTEAAASGRLPGTTEARTLDPAACTSVETRTLAGILAATRPGARTVTLGEPGGVSLVAVADDDGWLALTADTDAQAALAAVLLEAAAAAQGVADTTRAATRLSLPPPGAGGPVVPGLAGLTDGDPVDAAVRLLASAGVRPVAVPLAEDPAVAEALPHVVLALDAGKDRR